MADADKFAGTQLPRLERKFTVGLTGHREGNAAFADNRAAISATLAALLDGLKDGLHEESGDHGPDLRLVTNLANGSDLLAAQLAAEQGFEVFAPLPFGRTLNLALNMLDHVGAEVLAVAEGAEPTDPAERANWAAIRDACDASRCFELADQDDVLLGYLRRDRSGEGSPAAMREFDGQVAKRTRLASRITIEQSDVLFAIWDGISPTMMGGTLDTIRRALATNIPVIWIDARAPERIHWIADIADLSIVRERASSNGLAEIVTCCCGLAARSWSAIEQAEEEVSERRWRARSRRRFHAYRRIERMFAGEGRRLSSIRQDYEAPGEIAEGSCADLTRATSKLLGEESGVLKAVRQSILPRFALADGISTYLSDAYRGGMVGSFLLSAAAIIGGLAYLPLVGPEDKWPFALLELILLMCIVAITIAGTRGQWHQRWFRTRRVAEYLRHAPILVSVGCNRPSGHWPSARDDDWPELYARHVAMDAGLPRATVTKEFLKSHMKTVLKPFLSSQADYHRAKAARLARVHHNLDRMSEILFLLAILSVGLYLLLKGWSALGIVDDTVPDGLSKLLTFFGVAFPTLGASIAGIRYFGDFERFAAISDITTAKLEGLIRRSDHLLQSQHHEIDYGDFVALTRASDDVILEEIESWQSIFGTKKMSVPV